jgi:predicted DNA-binding protein YlxM (UPF0122 family)
LYALLEVLDNFIRSIHRTQLVITDAERKLRVMRKKKVYNEINEKRKQTNENLA